MQVLSDIIEEQGYQIPIMGMSDNSAFIKENYAFIALPGYTQHGNNFINHAIANGANCILTDMAIEASVPVIVIPELKVRLPEIAKRFFSNPSSKISLVGVTGTNGKSTIVYLLSYLLTQLGLKTAQIGTLGAGFSNSMQPTRLTTSTIIDNNELISNLWSNGAKGIAMEVSSIGLVDGRVTGLEFEAGIYTNLSRDHLDFHQTMQEYAQAKFKLFKDFCLKYAIVNIEDSFGRDLLPLIGNKTAIYTYGNERADFYAEDIILNEDGTSFILHYPEGTLPIITNLCGLYNVDNLLAVIAYLYAKGFSVSETTDLLVNLPMVPGRMQLISNDAIKVYVDYAHTPDALAKVLSTIKATSKGRLICVFGCGGDRDKEKRPLMGQIASELSDIVYITDDNPRYEDPKSIVNDILDGTILGNLHVIHDRKEAISMAIRQAKEDDCVLVAGKGHENTQEINGQSMPFSDSDIIKELLKTNG